MEMNQNNVDHHKVGLIYSGRGLGRYTIKHGIYRSHHSWSHM